MPGIDELLRTEGALWREEVDGHRPAAVPAPRRLPRIPRTTRGRVWTVAASGAVAAAVAVTAVALAGGPERSAPTAQAAVGLSPAKVPAFSTGDPALVGGARMAPKEPAPSSASSAGAAAGSTALIVTGSMSVVVRDNAAVDAAAVRATGITDGSGGRVDADDRQTTGSHRATLVLRVPNSQLASVRAQLARLGMVRSQQQQTRDVTGQVADVNSRVASARAAIAGLTRLYAKARTVGELITVESTLSARQSDLEALEAQQRALATQTSLATLTLSIAVRSHAAVPPSKHHSGFVGGVRDGWHAFTRTGLAVGQGLGAAVPFAVVVLLVGAGAVVFVRRRRAS